MYFNCCFVYIATLYAAGVFVCLAPFDENIKQSTNFSVLNTFYMIKNAFMNTNNTVVVQSPSFVPLSIRVIVSRFSDIIKNTPR